jgi:hypothetical protein
MSTMTQRVMWYPINYLAADNFLVRFQLPNGADVVGLRRAHRIKARRSSGERPRWEVSYHVRRENGDLHPLPKHAWPAHFRPKDKHYKFPLPAPAVVMGEPPKWQTPAAEPIPHETHDDLDWPGEYSEPGQIGEREMEVRLLRGLRTERSRNTRVGGRRGGAGLDSTLQVILRNVGKIEYEHETGDAPAIGTPGEAFEPTRRDHGDWDNAIEWYNALEDKRHQLVIWERSHNSSYRRIGQDILKTSHTAARKTYRAAIKAACAIANRPK